MKCPICQKPVDPNDSNAPFCSDRCRLIDLGNWAAGKYVISTPANPKGPMNSKGDESDEDQS